MTQSGDRPPVDFDKRTRRGRFFPQESFRLARNSPEIREGDPTLSQPAMFQRNADIHIIAYLKVEENQRLED